MESRGVTRRHRRRGGRSSAVRCEADWFGRCGGNRIAALKTEAAGMVLTESATHRHRIKRPRGRVIRQSGFAASRFPVGKNSVRPPVVGRGRLHSVLAVQGTARGRARFAGPAFREGQRKAPKACAFGCGGRNHPWAVAGTWPSVEPVAASAVAPDPCRGWGRNPSAHIRAQREPVFSPAGTGTDYRRPERSSDDSHHDGSGKSSGDPSRWAELRRSLESRSRDSGSKGLLVPRPLGAWRDARTVAEGDARWGSPAGCAGDGPCCR